MVKVYAAKIPLDLSENDITDFTSYIQSDKIQKIKNYKNLSDKYRSVLGELIVRYGVCKIKGCNKQDIQIVNKHKPYLIYPSNIYFNISHSKDWVVCAIASYPIGIDIEFIDPTRDYESIAERFFSYDEKKYVMCPSNKRLQMERFYKVWTLKECYTKTNGMGLQMPFKSFSICSYKKKRYTINGLDNYKLYSDKWEADYFIAISTIEESVLNQIEKVSLEMLRNY
ncbi:4'-phosphopantetheinyl transferase family protein [Blautia producta]|uniref:4'-phosphopantetheinyl transferase family protein n=1 Tax=Blautia producta TaxID=33035 RepID=UPI00210EFA38|nr:4'-phosphopantetheinyl transferase superfamily protein [Blautia producta]MCQ4744245.1 4'-phosphopantetheinyl transferase superfamily protein [Blautia producta]